MYLFFMKKLSLLLLLLILIPFQAQAAEFRSGDTVTLQRNETLDTNAYLAGGTVQIDGTVNGDLLTAGGTVHITGNIIEDATIAGGTIVLNGTMGDDVRIAGGNVVIQGDILGELLAVGGAITLSSTASTTGQVTLAGGEITLDGSINAPIRVYGDKVIIRGRVNDSVDIQATEVTVASSAVLVGKLTYSSPREATIEPGSSVQGGITYHQTEQKKDKSNWASFTGFAWLYSWLTALLLGAIIFALLPLLTAQVIRYSGRHAGIAGLVGLAGLILVPIIAILLMVTILGIPLGILLILLYIFGIIIGNVLGGIFLGSWIWKVVKKLPDFPVSWIIVLVGITLTSLLTFIPLIGWLLQFVVFLIGFGGIIWYAFNFRTATNENTIIR